MFKLTCLERDTTSGWDVAHFKLVSEVGRAQPLCPALHILLDLHLVSSSSSEQPSDCLKNGGNVKMSLSGYEMSTSDTCVYQKGRTHIQSAQGRFQLSAGSVLGLNEFRGLFQFQ